MTSAPQHAADYYSSTAYSNNSRPADNSSCIAYSRPLQLHSIQPYSTRMSSATDAATGSLLPRAGMSETIQ